MSFFWDKSGFLKSSPFVIALITELSDFIPWNSRSRSLHGGNGKEIIFKGNVDSLDVTKSTKADDGFYLYHKYDEVDGQINIEITLDSDKEEIKNEDVDLNRAFLMNNNNNYYLAHFSNAAEEEIASRSEAISDGAERVLNFSILYTHPPILPYIKHY
jgi:hypothetical protein